MTVTHAHNRILLLIIYLLFFFVPIVAFAQTTTISSTPGRDCADRPFSSKAEQEKVKREDPACYILRSNYGTGVSGDYQPLQDIDAPTPVQPSDSSSFTQSFSGLINLLQQLQSKPDTGSEGTGSDSGTGEPTETQPPSQPGSYETRNPDDFSPISYVTGLPIASSSPSAGEAAANNPDTGRGYGYQERRQGEFEFERIVAGEGRGTDGRDNQGFFMSLFYRPTLEEPARLLAPNLYVTWRHLYDVITEEEPSPDVPWSAPTARTNWQPVHFTGGIYAPIQNLILGAANGLVDFMVASFR